MSPSFSFKLHDPWFLGLVILATAVLLFWISRRMQAGKFYPALLVSSKRLFSPSKVEKKTVRPNRTPLTKRSKSQALQKLKMIPWEKLPLRWIFLVSYSVALLLFGLSLARPQRSFSKIQRSVEGIDILIVLDMSASMRVEDFRDTNRMDIAKTVIREFIEGRQTDRIGLVAFSGEPVSLAPPTLDYTLVLEQLRNIEIGDLKDGTAIGDGLSLGVTRLAKSTSKSKVIILITDGDNNMGQVDPLTAGELAKGFGIKVYSIAIGREGRVRMPFLQRDILGRTYKTYQYYDSSINPELLRQISAATGGRFYRVQDDPETFRGVFSEIDQLERTEIKSTQQVRYEERYQVFLFMGMVVLLLTFLSQETFLRVYP